MFWIVSDLENKIVSNESEPVQRAITRVGTGV